VIAATGSRRPTAAEDPILRPGPATLQFESLIQPVPSPSPSVDTRDGHAHGRARDGGSDNRTGNPRPVAPACYKTLIGRAGNHVTQRCGCITDYNSCTQSAGLEKRCRFYKARLRASSNALEYNPYPRHPLRCSLVVCYILEPTFIDPGDLSAVSVCMTALVAVSLKMPSWSPHEPRVQGRRPRRQMRRVPPFSSLVTTRRAPH